MGVNLDTKEGRLGRPNPSANPIGVLQAYCRFGLNQNDERFFGALILGSERPI